MKVIKEFVGGEDEESVALCKRFFADFDEKHALNNELDGLNYYKNFGFILLLLQHVSDIYWAETNDHLKYKNFLAQFEIFLSEKIMDAICNVSEKSCRTKDRRLMSINNDFDDDYTLYPAL